jgi:hypothetical protein
MNEALGNIGRFRDAAATVQSIAVTLAIAIGGVWTLVVFGISDMPKLERELREQANIQFKLKAEKLASEGPGRLVAVTVEATNSGNRATVLDFERPPLRVREISSDGDCVRFGDAIRAWPLKFVSDPAKPGPQRSRLRPSAQQTYHFVVQLPRPGAYWITMSVPLTETERAEWSDGDDERVEARKQPAPASAGKCDQMPAAADGPARTAPPTGRRWSGGTIFVAA